MSGINTNFFNSNGLFGDYSTSLPTINTKKTSIYGDYNLYDVVNQKYGINRARNSADDQRTAQQNTLGSDMLAAIKELTAKGSKSVFDKVAPASSDDKAVTATLDSTKWNRYAKNDPIELEIQQVATTQVNSGDGNKSSGKDFQVGTNRFEIEVGGKKYEFSFFASSSDTNESVQKKMAQAINDRKIGITASVSTDGGQKTSTLKLESVATGNKAGEDAPVFTVRDTLGDSASKMGITNTSQKAQNAVYSVNGGEEKTSTSNNIDLGNGVTATLKEKTESVTLTFKKDTLSQVNAVRNLVNKINEALSDAHDGSGKGSSKLAMDIEGMNKTYKNALEKIGIKVTGEGYLSIDADKMKAAAEDGSLEKMFQSEGAGSSYGFGARTQRIAENLKNTNVYEDEPSGGAYDPYGSLSSYNLSRGQISAYNMYQMQSNLLNMLF